MELRLNVPPRPAPLKDEFDRALERLRCRPDFDDLLTYGTTPGRPEDREAAAWWLHPRLGPVSPANVLVCSGGASALAALVTTFAKPGDTIVSEAYAYPGILAECRHFGLSLVGIPMDDEGLLPSALADACQRVRPKILYCNPTAQNPTTSTMSAERRMAIASVARTFDLTIIEDDAYGLLTTGGAPPLATFAPERTYFIASLSKCISPALRIAFCVAPADGMAKFTEGVRVVTFLASPIVAALTTELIRSGSARTIRDAIRTECEARQALAIEALDEWEFATEPQGPHLWLTLPGRWQIPELGEFLRFNQVAAKGDGFAVDGQNENCLRICVGAADDRDMLARSLGFLQATLRDGRMRVD